MRVTKGGIHVRLPIMKRIWLRWLKHHDFVQFLNLLIGIVLISLSVLSIFFSQIHMQETPPSTDYFYAFCGVLALWAAFTRRKELVYIVDLLIGLLLVTAGFS